MDNYQLLPNEAIILHSNNISEGEGRTYYGELLLTTINIVYVKKGAFGGVKDVFTIPLRNIKVHENRAQAFYVNNQNRADIHLDVYTKLGEKFSFGFQVNGRKEVVRWVNEINKIATGDRNNIVYDESKEKGAKGMVAGVFRTMMGSDPEPASVQSPNAKRSTQKCVGCGAPVTGVVGQMAVCEYCDMEQRIK